MNVALCCDDNYAIPSMVCLVSLFENNKDSAVHAYIITKGLSKRNICRFEKLASFYSQKIEIKEINAGIFNNLYLNSARWAIETYFRFLLPEIVIGDRVLYLDGDIMVRQNLKDLWNTDLSNYACAAVEDENGDDVCRHNRLNLSTPYFNAGVMLVNLKYWRDCNARDLLLSFLQNNREKCPLQDQDAMNAVFQNKVLFLDYKYNYQQSWFDGHEYIQLAREKLDIIKGIGLYPAIVHFCSPIKPWHKDYSFAFNEEYLSYAKKCDFIDFRIIHRHSLLYRLFDYCIRALIRIRYILTKDK